MKSLSSQNENISLQNISEIVKSKQRELNDIHDIQINQLEQVIEEKNKLLSEASRKFNLLRDDFQYNLTLLEARDTEITRLGQVELNLLHEIESKQAENKALLNKIEKLQTKEADQYQRSQQEKNQTKKLLVELKEEIESLRWSTNEEILLKTKEVASLQSELTHSHLTRQEALDSQRQELTQTYEKIIDNIERESREKEQYISEQIALLEKRFEQLTGDNVRLKNEGKSLMRKLEQENEERREMEEKCIQLEWNLNEKDREMLEMEDKLQRKLHALESELSSTLTQIEQMKSDQKREVDKLKTEAQRDKEYSALKLSHWEELYNQTVGDRERFDAHLQEIQLLSHQHKKEIEQLKEKLGQSERREEEERRRNERSEEKKMEEEREWKEKERLFEDLLREREREKKEKDREILQLTDILEEKDQRSKTKEEEYLQMTSGLKREFEEKLRTKDLEMKEFLEERRRDDINSFEEKEILRAELEAEFVMRDSERETERERERQELKALNERVKEEKDRIWKEKKEFERMYEEEKTECSALRLRLQLANGGKTPSNFQAPPGRLQMNTQQGGIALPSPMFSDDMGMLSIPASPSTPFSPRHSRFPSKQPLLPPTKESIESQDDHFSNLSLIIDEPGEKDEMKDNSTFLETVGECKRLKGVIREMRRDMESLQSEMSNVITEKENAMNRVNELEGKIQNATNEVNRLRVERKRLMDLNNELRSNIHKQRLENHVLEGELKQNQLIPESDFVGNRVTPAVSEGDHRSNQTDQTNFSGKSTKYRSTDRQTPSQEAALLRLKEKSLKNLQSHHPPRNKVVNYGRQENFL